MSAPPSPLTPPQHARHQTPAASSTDSRARHIAALDGLRGVAVLGVLLFHAGHFDGGFLGVDLFFVLSGFLITGLLLKEARTNGGRIRLAAFWGRRARRLTPALILMMAGTLLLTWAFGSGQARRQALDDTPWVAANLANWHFIDDQTGYWQASATQVFSHLWSVAVEEQFYLVWPLIIMLLVFLARGAGNTGGDGEKAGRRVAAVAAAGAVLSLVLMLVLRDPVDSTRVYEGTDTRAFSLLLGSLAATTPVARLLGRLGDRLLGRCALVLGCALAAYWFTADGQNSPGLFQGGLFLHALAAALLIACLAQAPRGPLGQALSAPPLRGLGLLSYSLYLWHWPVYVLLTEDRVGLTGWSRTAVLLAVSLAAAWLSNVLVEDPVRFRARWAHGRTGAIVLLAALLALAVLWALLPRPRLGAGTVDLTQLTATDSR
ncbi:acyltransferase [Streptomyces sp. NBC_00893]|uniref:acyltransferase family protein n=1 Tax=Streptomyces sp. NBC_00893 TaxID=2975862 RepID=UPI002256017E|nr:acyltransferase [Streptomyces sp. NBC_00893]MCX4851659.1 acyltransferase [Streptomyces sp. NBC_00893]